jgi:YidC/Oxa1 family membrane protein insertase
MDKNTITGFLLILLIIVGFSWLNKPNKEQMEAARLQQQKQDSIAMVESQKQNIAIADTSVLKKDSLSIDSVNNNKFGSFAKFIKGDNQYSTIGNSVMELKMASKGGRIASARLKSYVTGDSLPLILFHEEESSFDFSFFTKDNRLINTKDLYFTSVPTGDSLKFVYRLTVSDDTWLDYIYTLKENDYRLNFELKGHNLYNVISSNTNSLDFNYSIKIPQQEIGRKFEERYSGMNYKFPGDDVEKLNENKDDSKSIANPVKWVSFKDQFFACIVIAEKEFSANELSSTVLKEGPYLKKFNMTSTVGFDNKDQSVGLQLYMGPIKHSLLKSYDKGISSSEQLDLDKIVPLGGKIIRWANTGVILPMFNLFGKFISNYGLIILLMTFVIKLILFPFTYKSYMSSAKMKVLQPQINEINKKFAGNDKAAERSAATMDLYKRVGVSPMGGCLPMLLQMPILFAMYSFFPSSIELRQQSFLWAHDLSTYDAIISWSGNIPVISKIFGNHISLFCLLMTVTNLLYTRINMKTQPQNNQMPGMQAMMYLMPVMFLFMFNQYSAALSYYFFISTLISIAQTYAIRATVNDEKLLAKLNENKKKPVKKSGFAARIEQMQKDQQKMLRENQKKQKK